MAPKKIPARLEVILASKVRRAVILRRGPSRQVCSIGWDLSTDTFELGQWLKGRIHGFCCDISPDARYFVYDVVKPYSSEYQWTWTAISRVPYLKAIGRWGTEIVELGGGLFLAANRCLMIHWKGVYQECNEIELEPHQPEDDFRLDNRSVYIRRPIRDGWKLVGIIGATDSFGVLTFEKSVGGSLILQNIFDDDRTMGLRRGICPSYYKLSDGEAGTVQILQDWEWADVDEHRLLWAEGGKIFAAEIEAHGLGPAKMLHDFNDMTFQEIEAPY